MHKGFSFVEGISQCPTYFGRRNKFKSPIEMLKWQKENTINKKVADKLPEDKKTGKIVLGELYETKDVPEYTENYTKVLDSVREKGL